MSDARDADGAGGARSPGSSGELVVRARKGDARALDTLCGRYRARLVRWAHGRLPGWARAHVATEDVVQDVLSAFARRVPEIEVQGGGALESYLRATLRNRLTDELRRASHRPASTTLADDEPDGAPSPLIEAIGRETFERYERALARIPKEAQGLIFARFELEMSYAEIAEATGRPSADAARMAVSRAVLRVAEEMALHG